MQTLVENRQKIETWLDAEFKKTPPPPYCSVDLRNAGFKLTPVDTNLFPAGFNNLHICSLPDAVNAAKKLAAIYVPQCRRILLVPENHTRNMHYFESVATLQTIFNQAGYDVRVGSLLEELTKPLDIHLPSGRILVLEPVIRSQNRLGVDGFDPCLLLLNHDLSGGIPALLKDLEQKIAPPLQLGWWSRWKSDHFTYYQKVATELGELIGLDPWFINPLFDICDHIDFVQGEGEEALVQKTKLLLEKIQAKYQQYNINDKPYVVIKADSGTYGMGILSIDDPEEIRHLNHKERTKMSSLKGHQKIDRVIIQEGVYTIETRGHAEDKEYAAEPVIYMIGDTVVGGFYRIHKERKSNENLNAPGMYFEAFCKIDEEDMIVARLALLAAAREIQGTK